MNREGRIAPNENKAKPSDGARLARLEKKLDRLIELLEKREEPPAHANSSHRNDDL